METNKTHQSGHWRAYIDTDPLGMEKRLFVMKEDVLAKFEGGGLVMLRRPQDGLSISDSESMMAWSEFFDDDILDMWKAIGKALDVWTEAPGRAYAQGFAEGEAKVLREWNESLRVKALD